MFPRFDRPVQSAHEWSKLYFGADTRAEITRTTVGTAASVLLKNNPRRIFWRIRNRSAGEVYIDIAADPSTTDSDVLAPSGGQAYASVTQDGEVVSWEVRAVAALAGSKVWVYEVMIL